MPWLFRLTAGLIIVGSLLPIIRSDTWLIRAWDFPRLQLFFIGLAALIGLVITGRPLPLADFAIIAALAAALLFLAASMWRYTQAYRCELPAAAGPSALKVMVSNVFQSNRRSDELLAAARERKPDLLVALETDLWWTGRIAELAPLLPYSVEVPQDDTYGMVLRSRFPLIEPEVRRLFRENIPSIHGRICLDDGTECRFHAVHPKPPFPDESTSSTSRDAELLLVGKSVKEAGEQPTIVLGDLNDVAWSHTTRLFQRTSGLLDPRIGRGFFSTFHAGHAWMRWPLDHVFVSRHFRVRRIERLPCIGSDHFPIYADFSFEPDKGDEAPRLDPDGSDVTEANEKIIDAKAS